MESDVQHSDSEPSEERLEDQSHRTSWRALFNFTSRVHVIPLSIALSFSIASGIVTPALSIFLGKLFDFFTQYGAGQISGPDLVSKVSRYGLYLVGLGCVSGVLNASFYTSWLVFGETQAKAVRGKLFDGMMQKEMEWYDMREAGIDTLISRLQTQVPNLPPSNESHIDD